jgi:hypothetical protein
VKNDWLARYLGEGLLFIFCTTVLAGVALPAAWLIIKFYQLLF